jgi:tetratricopeptide (TPR) repeat protein
MLDTVEMLLKKGTEFHQLGHSEVASQIYTAILTGQPQHPDANYNMGLLAIGSGKIQAGLTFLETALEANADNAMYWISYIDVLLEIGRIDDAQAVFDQAKLNGAKGEGFDKLEQKLKHCRGKVLEVNSTGLEKKQPKQSNILNSLKLDQAINLAKKKAKEGTPEEAKRIYQDILTKFPKNKRASDGLEGLASRPVGKASKVQDPTQDQLQSLINLYSQGQLQEALKEAQNLVHHFPMSAVLFSIQGALLKGLGQFDLSIAAFNKALAIKPDYKEVYNDMGIVLAEQGKLEKAIEAYNKALAIKPNYAEAFYNMGVALVEHGKLEEAIEAYNKAVSTKPDYAGAFHNMGVALKEQGKLDEAIEAYNKALAIKPDHADAYSNMGIALKEQGKLDEAIEAYNKALAIKPDHADAYNNMGITLKDQGKLEEAIKAYNKALAIEPDYVEAYYNMGNALQEQGKLEEAIEAYNKALAIKPDNAGAQHNLAETLKIYSPKNNHRNPLINLDNKIKAKHNKHALPKIDQELAAYTLNLLNELQTSDKNLSTKYLQIYRRNTVDLNCTRHMQIFREKEIIPKFCFSCYKVQVDVTTVLDLIRLAALFYESEFESDLTRKCLVEVRPNIPGSYKGLIYCRGIDQAHSVKKQLDVHVRDIDKNLVAKIKKGCSEFPLAFPKYGEVASREEEMMQYPEEWQALESQFDEGNLITPKIGVMPSLKEFCLSDYLIIQKWIDYSKGIGDLTSELFCDLPVKYNEIMEVAKARVKQ